MLKTRKTESGYGMGLKAGLPVILGFVPVGIAYAIMARQAGFSIWQTCLMSLTVFAGASQMMATGMIAQGAGLLAIILATFILNLRHLIMSVCVINPLKQDSLFTRLVCAFGVTDESFAIFTTEKPDNQTAPFFLGLITVTWLSWNAGTLVGAVFSDFLPAIVTASLGIALYAMFIAILVPNLKGNGRLALLVTATGLCNLLMNQVLASSWALVASTLLCAFAGTFFVEP